jgi:hypothetical protein
MRKYLLFATITLILSMICLTSCKKDGVYNPKKKISKIFYQYSGGTKQLNETWTWDKNKLSKIDYGSGYYERFEYDKNQISKIIDSDGDYQKFTYDGSKINKIEFYYGNTLYEAYKFEHNGNKISKITIEEYDYDDYEYASKSIKNSKRNILRFILPEQFCEKIEKSLSQKKNRKAMETYTTTLKLTWKGNNVEEIVYEDMYDNELYAETSKYTYDKKKNPFDGLLSEIEDSFSKNNVTKMTTTDTDNNYWEYEYSYSYDGNFPKEVTQIYRSGSYTNTSMTYYEYED